MAPGRGDRGYERFDGRVEEFASDSVPSWPARPQAPDGAPNVVIMLIDDLGFSDLGPFGSEIETPHMDRLARTGHLLTNYHTAPMCSPSRASLLTGLNPHRVGFGYVAHVDPGFPGFACELPVDAPTLAESLRAAGYATFMVGKWHLTVESRLHDAADKSSWPVQRGFDRYFGCMDGFTTLFHPHRLIRDNSPVDIPEFPADYFLTDELTDRAIEMIDDLRANDVDKPFFLYYAHTSVHGPIQAKALDIEKYRGRYEAGWNALRHERYERQKATGVIPADAVLPEDNQESIRPWNELSESDRALFARHMEVYAAAVDEIDQSLGRLTAHLERSGELQNTIIVVASDNGGTAEGGPSGTRSYFAQFGMDHDLPPGWIADVPRDIDLIGGPRVFGQYPAGWARMSNTPFRDFKGSTYEGGVHAPFIISWPAGLPRPDSGSALSTLAQFVFVSDIAPTVLELTGVTSLARRAEYDAADMDGRSFAPALRGRSETGPRTQYLECRGRRAMFDGALKAVSPIPPTKEQGAAGGRWELYDLIDDPTETFDISADHPLVVDRLARQWVDEAWLNTVFPLDDDGSIRTVRPVSEAPLSEPVTLVPFRPPLERFRSSRLTVLRSFAIEMTLDLLASARGVVVAHGDQGGGYLMAVEDHRMVLAYNAYGTMHRAQSDPVEPGLHHVVLRVDEQPELRCSFTLVVDGAERARVDSVPMLVGMAPFTGISVGYDYGSPVDWDLYARHGANRFGGGTITSLRYRPGARSSFDPVVLGGLTLAAALLAD